VVSLAATVPAGGGPTLHRPPKCGNVLAGRPCCPAQWPVGDAAPAGWRDAGAERLTHHLWLKGFACLP
jgi:hypothetical protein